MIYGRISILLVLVLLLQQSWIHFAKDDRFFVNRINSEIFGRGRHWDRKQLIRFWHDVDIDENSGICLHFL